MKLQTATASKIIPAPAAKIYKILADYRNTHPQILPRPYFQSLDVEEGGVGAGTVVNFTMQILGRTQSFRAEITEPEPGRVLQEMDLQSGIITQFDVLPLEGQEQTHVKISTELSKRGVVEGWIAKHLLQSVYRQELEQLAKLASTEDPWGLSPHVALEEA